MPDIYMADISEFQANIDAPSYLTAYQCVICRTHNGNRPDNTMPGRMNYLRGFPFVAIGWYQYLVAGRDAAQQAHDFIGTIAGGLRPNEFPVLDLEEGGGDQTGRAAAWFAVVDAWAGFPAMLYSGDSFLTHQLGGSGRWPGRPIWAAAYGTNNGHPQTEPGNSHTLWQFSSVWPCTGVTGACDGSIHHNTAEEFIVSVRSGQVAPAPPLAAPVTAAVPPPPPPPRAPAPPSRAPDGNPFTILAEDGNFGPLTVRALQWKLGVAQDGQFGPVSRQALQRHLGVAVDGDVGPQTIRALQNRVGAPVDGQWGPMTTRSLQHALNLGSF